MEPEAKDIGEIELFSIEANAPNFCGCHAAVVLSKKGAKIRPDFERIILKRIRSKDNEVTFRLKIEKRRRQWLGERKFRAEMIKAKTKLEKLRKIKNK